MEKIGVDYFSLLNQDYLLLVDYFSKYPEVIPVSSKTAGATIKVMHSVFSRLGIPDTIVADSMPFNIAEFKDFSQTWNFNIMTSSPNFPQSNGLVERNVQTIKRVIRKAKESNSSVDLALLEYRNTPISGMNLSPAQLLMNRRLRSSLPMSESLLKPATNDDAQEQLTSRQQKQQQYYNRGARSLPPLSKGMVVHYKKGGKWEPAVVVNKHGAPRSYNIRKAQGNILRRNQHHLKYTKELPPERNYYIEDTDEMPEVLTHHGNSPNNSNLHEQSTVSSQQPVRVSSYGRPIRLPARYRDVTGN